MKIYLHSKDKISIMINVHTRKNDDESADVKDDDKNIFNFEKWNEQPTSNGEKREELKRLLKGLINLTNVRN